MSVLGLRGNHVPSVDPSVLIVHIRRGIEACDVEVENSDELKKTEIVFERSPCRARCAKAKSGKPMSSP